MKGIVSDNHYKKYLSQNQLNHFYWIQNQYYLFIYRALIQDTYRMIKQTGTQEVFRVIFVQV
jgi:hypothetical protein